MSPRPILLIGPTIEPTFGHTVRALHREGRDIEVMDLGDFWSDAVLTGTLEAPESIVIETRGKEYRLGDYRSFYTRLVDLRQSPDPTPVAAEWGRFRLLSAALAAQPALVVNRPGAGDSNASKPYQTALIERHGLRVPRSLSTNIPARAREFIASCPRGAIYKSNSGMRSIVQAVGEADLGRFDALRNCPVLFQERIWGDDVRVHVVGDACHAVRIRSAEVDYRYDRSGNVVSEPFELTPAAAEACVRVTRALGLSFSGIDLLLDADGELHCLEVNPMPGYSGYDHTLGGEISRSLGALLHAAGNSQDRASPVCSLG
ncbi:MAG: ATP-grasp domain-containing protein [Polyangiaceae bacterium]